jgi:hypothetical protein
MFIHMFLCTVNLIISLKKIDQKKKPIRYITVTLSRQHECYISR